MFVLGLGAVTFILGSSKIYAASHSYNLQPSGFNVNAVTGYKSTEGAKLGGFAKNVCTYSSKQDVKYKGWMEVSGGLNVSETMPFYQGTTVKMKYTSNRMALIVQLDSPFNKGLLISILLKELGVLMFK